MKQKLSKIILNVFFITLVISFLTPFYYEKLNELLQLVQVLIGLISVFCLSLWIALNPVVLNTFLNKFVTKYITAENREKVFFRKLNKKSQERKIKFIGYISIFFSVILGIAILGLMIILIYGF